MGINSWILLILSIYLSLYFGETKGQTTIPLGCIYPLANNDGDSNSFQQIIQLAVNEINSQQIIPNNYYISVAVRDTKGSERETSSIVYNFLQHEGVLGIIGSAYTRETIAAQRIASIFSAPQLSPATEEVLNNRNENPTFFRLVPPNNKQAEVLVSLIKSYGWKKVSVIYTTDSYGLGFWSSFTAAAEELNIVARQPIDIFATDISNEIKAIKKAKEDVVVLLSLASNAIPIINEAHKQEMIGNGQKWMGSEGVMALTNEHFQSASLPQLSTVMNGFIGLYPTASGSGSAYDRYTILLQETGISSPPLGAMAFYDACFMYAYALKNIVDTYSIGPDNLAFFTRDLLLASLPTVSFEGASGSISFDSDGNVNLPYDVMNWQNGEGFKVLGKWDGGSPPEDVIFSEYHKKHGISKVGLAFAVILPVLALLAIAYGVKLYIDRERILLLAELWNDEEFDEETFWDESLNLEVGGMSVDKKQLSFGLACDARFPIDVTLKDTLILSNNFSAPINFKIYAPINEGKFNCKIYPGHGTVKPGEPIEITVEMTLFCTTDVAHFIKIEVPGFENRYTCVQMAFEGEICDKLDPDELEITDTLGKGGYGTVYKGNYRGTVVAIKTMNAQSDWVDPELVSEFQRELSLLRKLKHPNVVSFVACSLVPKKMCLAIEFCENGELRGYMKRHADSLTPAFKFRVLLDVAKGMAFLHSAGVFHRDIKPDNVLLISDNVESAVVAKINDFGTARALALHQINQPKFHTKCIGTPVYMAPELYLVQPYNNKVDVYSYGILMWEILTEQMPFYFVDKPWDVYNYVTAGKRNPIPTEYPPSVTGLIQACWSQNPNERPTFPEIVVKMEELFKQSVNNKEFMAPAPATNRNSLNILKALQMVKKKRPFPSLVRARTMAGGVVVNVHDMA